MSDNRVFIHPLDKREIGFSPSPRISSVLHPIIVKELQNLGKVKSNANCYFRCAKRYMGATAKVFEKYGFTVRYHETLSPRRPYAPDESTS